MPQGYPDPFANLRATSDAPAAAEPETWWGGFSKGLGDYATDVGQGMMQSMAQPQTAGDVLGLMLPGAMAQLPRGAKSVAKAVTKGVNPTVRDARTLTGAFAGDRTTGNFTGAVGGLGDVNTLAPHPMPVKGAPASMPTTTPRPTAGFAYDWPEAGGAQYHVTGGPSHGSTVGEDTLRSLGIDVPTSKMPTQPPGIASDPMGKLADADAKLQRQGAASRLDPRDQGAGTLGDKPLPPGGTFAPGKTPIRMRLDEIPPEIRNQAPGTKFTDTETGIVYIRDKTGKLFIDRSKVKGQPTATTAAPAKDALGDLAEKLKTPRDPADVRESLSKYRNYNTTPDDVLKYLSEQQNDSKAYAEIRRRRQAKYE